MKKQTLTSLVVLGAFILAHFGKKPLLNALGISQNQWTLGGFTLYMAIFYVLIPAVVLGALHGRKNVLRELGWQGSFPKGFAFALVCTLPMLIGYALVFEPTQAPFKKLLITLYTGSFWAGLGEETLYRAFLFGQLYRHGKWPFVGAVLVQALVFGSAHLYQAHDWGQAAGVFGVTFAGALWFAWLWIEWKNLWVNVWLHILMNAWWACFEVSSDALGGVWANVFRGIAIAISVILTLRYLRKQGRKPLQKEPFGNGKMSILNSFQARDY